MFIPHAKAMSRDLAGVNSSTTGSFRGSGRLLFKDGNMEPFALAMAQLAYRGRERGLSTHTDEHHGVQEEVPIRTV